MMKALMAVPLSILGMIAKGFVFKTLWAWFVVTAFPQAPYISLPLALGLSEIFALLSARSLTAVEWKAVLDAAKNPNASGVDSTDTSIYNSILGMFVCGCILLGAWVIKLFM